VGGGALERDLPLLGICRGMQMLNVAAGGTICQHLPDAVGHERHRETPNVFGHHEVALEPGSLAARAAGEERHSVRSYHHQGPDELGGGVVATGVAVGDGTVEAIELPSRSFALGVLWHPEEDETSRVVAALVAEVDRRRATAGTR
jgi:putative glutamine amidotransferase